MTSNFPEKRRRRLRKIRDNHLLETCPHTRMRTVLKEREKGGLHEGPRRPEGVIIQDPVGRYRAE
jgi:hypothetical protein